MPGQSVTAKPHGPLPLLTSLAFAFLTLVPASMARAQEERRSLVPVASLPPLEAITRERVRDHAVILTAEDKTEQPDSEEIPADALSLRADAGDDQIGLVGRQMTLNGSRSRPHDGLGYRWIQVGGPQVDSLVEDGRFLTFTPKVSGIYRFVLVVASGSRISRPDNVEVIVGVLDPSKAPGPVPQAATGSPVLSTEELARTALASIAGGPEAAESLAEILDAVAERMDLYETYADVFSEVSRRLEGGLPAEPAQRAVWARTLFLPLSARLVEQLRDVGLDLSRSEGAGQPLTQAQKGRLVEQFRTIATGFLETRPAR